MNRIKNAFSHLTKEIRGGGSQMFRQFHLKSGAGRAKSFFASNTLVAYVAFLLLMVVLFLIVVRVGTSAMVALTAPPGSPSFYVRGNCHNSLSGSCSLQRYQPDATVGSTWSQDPNSSLCTSACPGASCQTVLRSKDGRYGIEFTWSIWLYINKIGSSAGTRRQHIFSKGSDTMAMASGASCASDGDCAPPASVCDMGSKRCVSSSQNPLMDKSGMLTPNNAPGLYLDSNKNSLYVVMNTFDMIDEEVEVNDIPLNKWINVMIRVEGRTLDVYINGTIAVRHQLSSVPKQNYGDVHATKNGGFNGQWSRLHYYDHSLNTSEIMDIVRTGPDLRHCLTTPITPPYLSMQWYFDNPQD